MFLSLVPLTFLTLGFRPEQIPLVCSDSRGLVRSSSFRLRVLGLFSYSMFRDKVSLSLALILLLGCVSFPASEPGVRLLRGSASTIDSLNLWEPRPLTRQFIQEAKVTP